VSAFGFMSALPQPEALIFLDYTMPDEQQELQPSEKAHRALAGLSEGVAGATKASIGNIGLLALAPFIRRGRSAPPDLPPQFKTDTREALANLVATMTGGQNPSEGRNLRLDVLDEPGKASLHVESRVKGRAPKDWLRLSRGISPETVAHEVGHATTGNKLERFSRYLSGIARSKPASFLPSLLALTGSIGPEGKDGEPHALAKAAPYVGGAQLASILGEETRANIRGARILDKIKYPGAKSLRTKLKLLLPTLSYLGKAGLLVGAPLGVLKGMTEYGKARSAGNPMSLRSLLTASPTQIASTPPLEDVKKRWADRLNT